MPLKLSLLCLPCAGASATMYLRWRRLLPRWIEVVPVELPGRGSRLGEGFVADFDRMVGLLCAEHKAAMRGPFALFGHSMAALLAWGIAQRLSRQGRPLPSALLVSGSAAPSQRDPDRFVDISDDEALVADLRKQAQSPHATAGARDFIDFVSVVLPGARVEGTLTPGSGLALDEAAVAKALEGLLLQAQGEASSSVYAAFGSQELARIFTVARHLKALSLRAGALPALQCQVDCWWISERAADHRSALAHQLNQPVPADRELALGHFEIVRSAALLEEIGAALLAAPRATDPAAA